MLSWGSTVNFYLSNVVCKEWVKTSYEQPQHFKEYSKRQTLNEIACHLNVIQSVQNVTDRQTHTHTHRETDKETYKQNVDTIY